MTALTVPLWALPEVVRCTPETAHWWSCNPNSADSTDRAMGAAAVALCRTCPMRERCLDEGRDGDELIWGGKWFGHSPSACRNGHDLTADDAWVHHGRARRCRLCARETMRRYRQRRTQEKAA